MSTRISLLFLLILLLTACSIPSIGGDEFQPLRLQAAPWQDGEVSEYNITDRNGSYAGTLRYEIRASSGTDERELWIIQRAIDALGDQEMAEIVVEAVGFRPLSSSLVRISEEGRQSATTIYDSGQVDIELTTAQDIVTPERMNVPSDVRDRRTLVMLARTLTGEDGAFNEGYRTRLNSFLPVAGLVDRTQVVVGAEESLDTLTGSVIVRRVGFLMQSSEIVVWVASVSPYSVVRFTDSRNGGTYELVRYQLGL